MSWMDGWSRPSKSQVTPAPFYLIPGRESTPYCHSCGRAISGRHTTFTTKTKYCSSRCRTHKPGKLDRDIEKAFVAFLSGEYADHTNALPDVKGRKSLGKPKRAKHGKGDDRVLVACSAIEGYIFGQNRPSVRDSGEDEHHHIDDSVFSQIQPNVELGGAIETQQKMDGDVLAQMAVRSGSRMRPSQAVSEVNGSVGGEKGRAERLPETEAMLKKRKEGQPERND